MRDISLRNLTESRGFEDEKTEDAVHQCSACGMYDDICTSGQCTCSGGGTPENGVTAQEDTAVETIPFEGTTITKGGNYEIPEGKYAGNITVELTDTSEPVNIAIKGGITYNGKQQVMFINVKNADEVTITNDGHEVNCAPVGAHFMDVHSGNVTVNGGTYVTTTRNLVMAYGGTTTLNDMTTVNSGYAVTSSGSATVVVNRGTHTHSNTNQDRANFLNELGGHMTLNDVTATSEEAVIINNTGTVEAPNGTAIDISGESGDVQLNGGTIRNSVTGVRVADAGDSEIDLKAVTFENNTDDISLGNDQQINIKKSFAGTAKIRVDDPARGRQITTDNEDLSYQNKLKLVSRNSGYIIGYKRDANGVEFRYLAPANGNTVNAVNAKATANIGAGEQELDTATVVPEHTTVTVTANLPEGAEGAEGAEFLGWSAVCADGRELDLGDDQTAHFEMPGCNVTVEALYQGGNVDIDNPSGSGSSDVVAGIAAVALTGAAVWGIYETGTGIYRVLNMPGVPMPSNRAGLATLIWEKAGCPEPQTVKSFSDIDDTDLHLRQAASWMEEQGLMDDVKENEFRPYRYVTKLQTCLVWDKAKEKSLIS